MNTMKGSKKAPQPIVVRNEPLQRKRSCSWVLDEVGAGRIGRVPDTNPNPKKDIISVFRPEPLKVADYNISQTDARYEGNDVKMHLQQTYAKYTAFTAEEQAVIDKITFKKTIYSHGGPPVWEFPREVFLRRWDKEQKVHYANLLARIKARKKAEWEKWKHDHKEGQKRVGPDWFQELSPRQKWIIDGLKKAMKLDVRYRCIVFIQNVLQELGVSPAPSKRKIKKALFQSGGCPVEFLLVLYQLINPNRIKYSLNDRLLLSAVVHLTLSDTIRELDTRIPSPPKKKTLKVCFKAKIKPHRKYKSPYLVPYTFDPKIKSVKPGTYKNPNWQYPVSPYFKFDASHHKIKRPKSKSSERTAMEIEEEFHRATSYYCQMFDYCGPAPIKRALVYTCADKVDLSKWLHEVSKKRKARCVCKSTSAQISIESEGDEADDSCICSSEEEVGPSTAFDRCICDTGSRGTTEEGKPKKLPGGRQLTYVIYGLRMTESANAIPIIESQFYTKVGGKKEACVCKSDGEPFRKSYRIVSGMKRTESGKLIPIIEGIKQSKPCRCLEKYGDTLLPTSLEGLHDENCPEVRNIAEKLSSCACCGKKLRPPGDSDRLIRIVSEDTGYFGSSGVSGPCSSGDYMRSSSSKKMSVGCLKCRKGEKSETKSHNNLIRIISGMKITESGNIVPIIEGVISQPEVRCMSCSQRIKDTGNFGSSGASCPCSSGGYMQSSSSKKTSVGCLKCRKGEKSETKSHNNLIRIISGMKITESGNIVPIIEGVISQPEVRCMSCSQRIKDTGNFGRSGASCPCSSGGYMQSSSSKKMSDGCLKCRKGGKSEAKSHNNLIRIISGMKITESGNIVPIIEGVISQPEVRCMSCSQRMRQTEFEGSSKKFVCNKPCGSKMVGQSSQSCGDIVKSEKSPRRTPVHDMIPIISGIKITDSNQAIPIIEGMKKGPKGMTSLICPTCGGKKKPKTGLKMVPVISGVKEICCGHTVPIIEGLRTADYNSCTCEGKYPDYDEDTCPCPQKDKDNERFNNLINIITGTKETDSGRVIPMIEGVTLKYKPCRRCGKLKAPKGALRRKKVPPPVKDGVCVKCGGVRFAEEAMAKNKSVCLSICTDPCKTSDAICSAYAECSMTSEACNVTPSALSRPSTPGTAVCVGSRGDMVKNLYTCEVCVGSDVSSEFEIPKRTIKIIAGMKKTDSGHTVPIVEGLAQLEPCECEEQWVRGEKERRRKARNDPHCYCREKVEQEIKKNIKPTCRCPACEELREARRNPKRMLKIICGIKETKSGRILPIIDAIKEEFPCDCLQRYTKLLDDLEDYKKRLTMRWELRAREQVYQVQGVCHTSEGPVYILNGVAEKECPCAEMFRKQEEEAARLAKMPKVPPGRVQYGISAVHEQPDGNVFVIDQALDQPCTCEKIYRKFMDEHDTCMRVFDIFMDSLRQNVAEMTKELQSQGQNDILCKDFVCPRLKGDLSRAIDEQICSCPLFDQATGDAAHKSIMESRDSKPIPPCSCEPSPPGSRDSDRICNCDDFETESTDVSVCVCPSEDEGFGPGAAKEGGEEVKVVKVQGEEEENPFKRYFIKTQLPRDSAREKKLILKQALASMAEDGYPLAKLPEVHKLKELLLWMSMKGGKRWPQEEKWHTHLTSQTWWKHSENCNPGTRLPKLPVTMDECRKFTWRNAVTVKKIYETAVNDYYRKIRQKHVAMSRELFSTMFPYKYPTLYLREHYFAYMPDKEINSLAVQKWRSFEKKDVIRQRSCFCK